jgi:type IV pilus assembly protein PilC
VLVKAMPAFRRQLSKLNLYVPVVGRLLVVSNSSSFARIASALIESGVEIVDAMKISATVIKNYHMHQSVVECLDDVRLGAPLHSAFAKLKIFEPLFVSMVEIGEQSSMLDETFGKMADLYEAESNDATRKLTAVIEPVMTMLIGLMIALLVISIILPMFNMYGTILG